MLNKKGLKQTALYIHNTKGDVALINISREKSDFHGLQIKFLAFPQPHMFIACFLLILGVFQPRVLTKMVLIINRKNSSDGYFSPGAKVFQEQRPSLLG